MSHWIIKISNFLAIFTSVTLIFFLYVEWGMFVLLGVLWASDYETIPATIFTLYLFFWSLKQGGLVFLCISVYVYLSHIYSKERMINRRSKIGLRMIWAVYSLCSFLVFIFFMLPYLPKLMPATLAVLVYILQVLKPNVLISIIFNIFYVLFFTVLCIIFPPNFNWALVQYLGPSYSNEFLSTLSFGLALFGGSFLFFISFYQIWYSKLINRPSS